MDTLTDEQLRDYDKLGLIPGPDESEADFLKRVEYCLNLKVLLKEGFQEQIPFPEEDPDAGGILKKAFPITRQLYCIAPEWIPLYFSNYKLNPWHGGCAWIFQQHEGAPTSAFFQLRQALKTSDTYLCLYGRNELVAHELAHVGRMMFNEPKFEEMLACQTSCNKFRRHFGALVEAPWESALFVFTLATLALLDLSATFAGYPQLYLTFAWLKSIPAAMLLYALARLWRRQTLFSKCFGKLKSLTGSEQMAHAMIYRLTDREICDFAKMEREAIAKFTKENSGKSLRWRLLNLYQSSVSGKNSATSSS